MLEKEGTAGEEEAKKAYRAAREESDHAAEAAAGDRVSSALIDRVRTIIFFVQFGWLKNFKFGFIDGSNCPSFFS